MVNLFLLGQTLPLLFLFSLAYTIGQPSSAMLSINDSGHTDLIASLTRNVFKV